MTQLDSKTDSKTLQWSLPDADSTAETVIHGALDFCAQKMGLDNAQMVLDHLGERDKEACGYCQYSIAKQVGDSLGALDQNIKAVYILDFDAVPGDICFAEASTGMLIHLIVWSERKTSALDSLVAALDRALAHSYGKLLNMGKLEFVLDVQVVDDSDVENRVGYGAMLSSLHQRPIQVWKR